MFSCAWDSYPFSLTSLSISLFWNMHYSHAWSKTLDFSRVRFFHILPTKLLLLDTKKYFASASKFAILYATSLCVNVLVNEIMIAVLGVTDFLILVAFIFATAFLDDYELFRHEIHCLQKLTML